MAVSPSELAGIPLFASLGEVDREVVASWFDVTTSPPGERLVGEGAAGYEFLVLLEGTAVVTSEGAELARLGPGDFFGELAFFADGRRSATVTSSTATKALVLFGTRFRQLQLEHPEIAEAIGAAARRRFGNAPDADT